MVSLKKKSKRRTTRLRAKIEKKAAAKTRKQRKQAKKSTQWKSHVAKDPGIPNSFPGKLGLLEKIAKQKQKSNEPIKKIPNQSQDLVDEQDVEMNRQLAMEDLIKDVQNRQDDFNEKMDYEDTEKDDGLVKKIASKFRHDMNTVIEASDIVLFVLDARDPEKTRSRQVERLINSSLNKILVFILNKIDLVPFDVVDCWLKVLSRSAPVIPMRTKTTSKTLYDHSKNSKGDSIKKLMSLLKTIGKTNGNNKSLSACVIGYPNVGKSTIINSICSRPGIKNPCVTGSEAGVTVALQRIKLDKNLTLIDSPGVILDSTDNHEDLALLNAISVKNLPDVHKCIVLIVQKLVSDERLFSKFCERYSIPAVAIIDGNVPANEILIHVARKFGRIGRNGIPNLDAAAKIIINDWNIGNIEWWTSVPPGKSNLTTDDRTIVNTLAKEFKLDDVWDSTEIMDIS